MLPFVVIDSLTNTIMGATCLYDLCTDRLTAETGHTYYAPCAQGTGINTECKCLLFQHAFEKLGLVRVQLKTDERNLRAQRAIEKLGVRKEGLIRNERKLYNGTVRNAVIYGLTREDWPEIKNRLPVANRFVITKLHT
ncbi:GNAT family N-acetyltransferase [Laceyella tengchongensis]|jgi:RimJ/RimL family protein N-acetyltransferase